MSLLGIDIGSSRCKGVAFGSFGNIVAQAEAPYMACVSGEGRMEMDADIFWNAVLKVTNRICADAAADPVEALAVASHGETFIPVDSCGSALSPAVMNADNRAGEQSDRWAETLGRERIYAITGLPLHPMFTLNKIMWLRDHEPEVFDRAVYFVDSACYVLMRMGFPHVTDYSLACRFMAFDINKKRWSEEILDQAGISAERLPIPLPSGYPVGRLAAEAARSMGLRPGVQVALGGHDQPCGALGASNISAGQVSDSTGTYESLAASSDAPMNTARALVFSLNSYCHVVSDRYITLAFFPSGMMVRWFVEQFCGEDAAQAAARDISVYDLLEERVRAECPSPTGINVIPHLVGSCNPFWNVRATGVFAGITPDVTRVRLYKAVFEGIACEMALNAQVLQEIVGSFDSVQIFGGNARSEFTMQLRADISQKRIAVLPHSEMVCQGAAMLAGIGAGLFKDAAESMALAGTPVKEYAPRVDAQAEYGGQIEKYSKLFSSLEGYRNDGR